MAATTINLRGRLFQDNPPGTILVVTEANKFAPLDSVAVDANGDAAFSSAGIVDGGRYWVRRVSRKVVSLVVSATAGQFKVGVDGVLTADNTFDIAAATLKTAIEGLSTVGTGNVLVTGGPGDAGGSTPYVITFDEALAGENPALTAQNGTTPLSGGSASATPTITTAAVKLTDAFPILRFRQGNPAAPVSGHPVARRASGVYYPGV
jgi:hypothetical protein